MVYGVWCMVYGVWCTVYGGNDRMAFLTQGYDYFGTINDVKKAIATINVKPTR